MNNVAGESALLPPGPRLPKTILGFGLLLAPRQMVQRLRRRYGPTFSVNVPIFGPAVVTSEPALIKQVFRAGHDVVDSPDRNLGDLLGPGSMFSLRGQQHQQRRKLLAPPFHGKRMRAYESIVEEETLRETANWPQGQEFAVMPSTMRITLNVILRAVFGAEGAEFAALRTLLPPMVATASRLSLLPWARKDLGPMSPWGRHLRNRRRFDDLIETLIAKALADPDFEERSDVLSLMLQARYDDGTPMSHSDIADELLTLLAAGHETTATTLAWAVERLRRHPAVLRRLVEEVDAEGSAYLQATIYEVQRIRPVIGGSFRKVVAPTMQLGAWVIPRGYHVMVSSGLTHRDDSVFPDPRSFDPDRFTTASPDVYAWIPFGGGRRRCIGAAFANMEMNVVLRTLLREFDIAVTDAAGERWHWRGVAFAPADGGRVIVHRRPRKAEANSLEPSDRAATAVSEPRPIAG